MSQVKQVKEAINIVDVIGQRLELKNAGVNYKALCPFHSEKSPSFFVNEQFQRYRCFGCGASGDVFNFLENYDNMTFAEALEYLAKQAGIKLDQYHKTAQDEERERLLEILSLSADYYHYLLTKHSVANKARDYLKSRKISSDSIKLFKLGYAANDWDALLNFLHQKKKFSKEDILKTGLVVQNQTGRYYDRFRGRIMFPLKNHRGLVVGFSGRLLQANVKEAKYINTPETHLYHKSQMLYGYSENLLAIKQANYAIVCEGEFDVIASSQNHVGQIVAIKGSALTLEQIKLLERTVKKVVLCLDTDSAGVQASQRAIALMNDSNVELRVIDVNHFAKLHASVAGLDKQTVANLPNFKDAGELIETNPRLWREVAKHSESIYEFLMRITCAKHNAKTIEGKKNILADLAVVITGITHSVEQDFYIQKLAKILEVKADFVRADLQKIASKSKAGLLIKNTKLIQTQEIPLAEKLEQYLLFLSFHLPVASLIGKLDELLSLDWQTLGAKQILAYIKPNNFQFEKFASSLSEDLKAQLMDWYLLPEHLTHLENLDLAIEWQNTFNKLQKIALQNQAKQLDAKLKKLDALANKTADQEAEFNETLQTLAKVHAKLREVG